MNIKGDWNWKEISARVPISDIYRYPYLPWNRYGLSHNINITVDIIETLDLPNATGEWNWYAISMHINISEIIRHPYLPWNKLGLSSNRGIAIHTWYYLDLPNATSSWSRNAISANIAIAHIGKKHDMNCTNNIDIEASLEWYHISQYMHISNVIANPERRWNKHGLSMNKGITLRDIECIDMGFVHELQFHRYPKIIYKRDRLCDIEIICSI